MLLADYHTLSNVYLFIVNIKPNKIISYSFPTAARVCDEIFLILLLFPKFTLEKCSCSHSRYPTASPVLACTKRGSIQT